MSSSSEMEVKQISNLSSRAFGLFGGPCVLHMTSGKKLDYNMRKNKFGYEHVVGRKEFT